LKHPLDLFEDRRVLSDTHAYQLLRSPVLVENVVRVLPELFHICPDEHLPQFDEITVLLVIHLDNTPGVSTAANLPPIRSDDEFVGSNDSEGDFAGNLLVFRDGLLILVVVRGRLEDVDVVVGNIRENLEQL
jgi:hypothetical protein